MLSPHDRRLLTIFVNYRLMVESISSSVFNRSKEKSVAYIIIVLEKSLGEILLSSTKLL